MGDEFLRSHYLRFLGRHQVLKQDIAGDKKVAFIGAAEDKNVICVHQSAPQRSRARDQSFSFGEVNWQHSQMISNLFKFGLVHGIRCEKQFLKHNVVNGNANTTLSLRGKQLNRRWITLHVSDDYAGVQEHEWTRRVRALATFEHLRLGHLFHVSIVRRYGSGCSPS
jgi:hypothetical protein